MNYLKHMEISTELYEEIMEYYNELEYDLSYLKSGKVDEFSERDKARYINRFVNNIFILFNESIRCITLLNQDEEYELSQIIYDNIKKYYLFFVMSQDDITLEDANDKFNEFFNSFYKHYTND